FRKLFQLDCSPQVLAISSAVGGFHRFFPHTWGFHTALAIGISFIFSLPMYPLLLGAYITNPLTIVFVYALCYRFGKWVLRDDTPIDIDWANISLAEIFEAARSILLPFFVGTHLVGLIFAVITYFVIYYIAVKYRENT
ncbi:MAG: DUF2062 domain-containing protein, partial [Geovibrio sp.]|nr:DUF2062 domain-containing protein [Geovibrio sp.]